MTHAFLTGDDAEICGFFYIFYFNDFLHASGFVVAFQRCSDALCVRVWQIYQRPSIPSHRTSSCVDVFHFNLKKNITRPAWTKCAMLNSAHGTCILIVFICVRVDVCMQLCGTVFSPEKTTRDVQFYMVCGFAQRL